MSPRQQRDLLHSIIADALRLTEDDSLVVTAAAACLVRKTPRWTTMVMIQQTTT
jgi:hypothetical protein